jgi:hypothetical protein
MSFCDGELQRNEIGVKSDIKLIKFSLTNQGQRRKKNCCEADVVECRALGSLLFIAESFCDKSLPERKLYFLSGLFSL